jgi:hypothetical protein
MRIEYNTLSLFSLSNTALLPDLSDTLFYFPGLPNLAIVTAGRLV